jgi:predicted TIM-barrel fold metal-dependent hydrolase
VASKEEQLMKIDIYAHIVTEKYLDILHKHTSMKLSLMEATPTLVNLENRFRIMDRFEGLLQVLVPGVPPLELMDDPKVAIELAQIHNDEVAELIVKYPDRFAAAVAVLPIHDIEATLKELDRAINELRFRGIWLLSPIYSRSEDKTQLPVTKPVDLPEFMPIYERMAKYNLPIWLHPFREHTDSEYTSETRSKYQLWQVFGWPYETTAAMTRLVFSGIFEKYPNLKIITHHSGAMVPFLEQRISVSYDNAEMRLGASYTKGLTKSPLDYFRMFYADTAIGGSTPGLMCAYAFFGAKQILFGTDMPYDNQIGYRSITRTIESIERMDIPPEDREAIFVGNAKELLRLPV